MPRAECGVDSRLTGQNHTVSSHVRPQWENNTHWQKMNSTTSVVKKMAANFVTGYFSTSYRDLANGSGIFSTSAGISPLNAIL
jgi:hypothetical protein